jgi:hypothetical protein
MTRRILVALTIFVALAGCGLVVALVTSATSVFNVLIWLLFTVLWIAFAAALAFSPATLDDVWHAVRGKPLLVQGVAWLLFLPIMVALWIWEQTWALPVRLVLVIATGAWNLFLFFPRN